MIVFDLSCSDGHRFEGWFGSSDDYADQHARGLLACPVCGSAAVSKAPMAPAVPAKGNTRAEVLPPEAPKQLANTPMPPEVQKALQDAADEWSLQYAKQQAAADDRALQTMAGAGAGLILGWLSDGRKDNVQVNVQQDYTQLSLLFAVKHPMCP